MLDTASFSPIAWPRVLRVRQPLPGPPELADLDAAVESAVAAVADRITGGHTYAIGVGSRGIARLPEIVRALVAALDRRGARAFIVPAMGSHGGGTAEGQVGVLASLGVTEASVGAPIRPSMEAHPVGEVEPGLMAYTSAEALTADGIIPVGRIKPHTAFHGPVESGIMKMVAIGFGKHRGALSVHRAGFPRFAEVVPGVAETVLRRVPMPFGLAILENGYDRPAKITALPPDGLRAAETALLEQARAWMARLPFETLDVLVVGELGKNISGDGMDPNVTGRYAARGVSGGPQVQKIVVLSLTPETHGNAMGIGMADVIPHGCYAQLDLPITYINSITSTELSPARIPLTLRSDRDTLDIALRTVNGAEPEAARLVAIRNTLRLEEFVISEALWPEAEAAGCERRSDPEAVAWREDGRIAQLAGLQLYSEPRVPTRSDEQSPATTPPRRTAVPQGGVEHEVEAVSAEAGTGE